MPVNFIADAGAYPAEAFFPELPLLDDVIASIPGLLGAFDAVDYTGAGPWMPRIGTGASILPAAAGTPPMKANRDGSDVLRFAVGSKAFVNNYAGAALAFSGLTYASRAYFSNDTTNFQKVFDLGTPEFYFRSTMSTKVWQFAGLGASGSAPISTPLLGWHDVIFTKNADDPAALDADGSGPVPFGSSGAALSASSLVLGDASNSTSAVHDISRMILCSVGVLTSEQRNAIRLWLRA